MIWSQILTKRKSARIVHPALRLQSTYSVVDIRTSWERKKNKKAKKEINWHFAKDSHAHTCWVSLEQWAVSTKHWAHIHTQAIGYGNSIFSVIFLSLHTEMKISNGLFMSLNLFIFTSRARSLARSLLRLFFFSFNACVVGTVCMQINVCHRALLREDIWLYKLAGTLLCESMRKPESERVKKQNEKRRQH